MVKRALTWATGLLLLPLLGPLPLMSSLMSS